jgi:hypothetical protein
MNIDYPFVKIIFKNRHYYYAAGNDIPLEILGSLLTDDVGCYRQIFREWIDDAQFHNAEGNTTVLNKDGDHIVLGDLFSEQEDEGPFLRMHRDELARILDEWKGFCQTKPKEILITYNEQGKIILAPTY